MVLVDPEPSVRGKTCSYATAQINYATFVTLKFHVGGVVNQGPHCSCLVFILPSNFEIYVEETKYRALWNATSIYPEGDLGAQRSSVSTTVTKPKLNSKVDQ